MQASPDRKLRHFWHWCSSCLDQSATSGYTNCFLPCDATLAQHICLCHVSVHLSACRKSGFYQNVQTYHQALSTTMDFLRSQAVTYAIEVVISRKQRVNLILVPVPPVPSHLFLHPSLLPLLFHHSITSSLFHSRLK